MTVEELRDYVSCGREIEFEFKGKRYSITYFEQNKKAWISFCEFYQEPTDVKTVDELLMVERYGITVKDMLASCTEKDIWIF